MKMIVAPIFHETIVMKRSFDASAAATSSDAASKAIRNIMDKSATSASSPKTHRSTETVDADGERLSASLNSLEFGAEGNRTRLTLTVQVVAFGGRDMIEGTKFGYDASLDDLAKYHR